MPTTISGYAARSRNYRRSRLTPRTTRHMLQPYIIELEANTAYRLEIKAAITKAVAPETHSLIVMELKRLWRRRVWRSHAPLIRADYRRRMKCRHRRK